jgi:hypothetical protein
LVHWFRSCHSTTSASNRFMIGLPIGAITRTQDQSAQPAGCRVAPVGTSLLNTAPS